MDTLPADRLDMRMTDKPSFTLPGITGFGRKKPKPDTKYAGFNRRMLAATVDSALLVVTSPLVNRWVPINFAALQSHVTSADQAIAQQQLMQGLAEPAFITSWFYNLFAQIVVLCLFSALCWHYWSATPGKMLLGIRIADATTEKPISGRQIILRLLGYVISGGCFLMGFFWIAFDKRRQGWHDKIAHTVVLTVPFKTIVRSLTAGRLGSRDSSSGNTPTDQR